MADKLNLGDTFPALRLSITDGTQIEVPSDLERPYAVLLFYRGHW